MFLMGKRLSIKSLTHPIVNQAKKLTPAEVQRYLTMLRAGDATAGEPMVRHFIRDGIVIACKYATVNRSRFDLVSEAVTAIVDALRDISEGKLVTDDVEPFVKSRIHAGLAKFIRRDHIFGIPRSTAKDMEARGEQVPDIREIPLPVAIVTKAMKKRQPILDTHDMIDACIRSEIERRIVDLRIEDFVDQEIAQILDMSVTGVFRVRDEVRRRYEEKEREL